MTYKEWIESMRQEWSGARVLYEGKEYMVTGVDYNGGLLIDKPARFTDTTAVGTWMVTRRGTKKTPAATGVGRAL